MILGAEVDGVDGASSSIAITGGLVAKGDGPWAARLDAAFVGGRRRGFPGEVGEVPGEKSVSEPLPNPKPAVDAVGDVAGGLEAVGVGMGGVPELNSAQRGHLRFVSAEEAVINHGDNSRVHTKHVLMCPIWPQCPHRLYSEG